MDPLNQPRPAYLCFPRMSMLSFALMKPYTPKYSIHYDGEDAIENEENGSLCPSSDDENAPPEHPKNAHKVYRYMTRDAIINRATFLVVVGLIVIFSICVARDGAIDNMEWLRKQLTMDYVSIEKNRKDILAMSNLVAHGGFGPKIPLLLVIGVDTDGETPYAWKPILSYLKIPFKTHGFNTSAVLWGKNSTYPPENCIYDDTWDILTMSSINASTPEYLINYLTEVMKVSVFYLDADAISRDLFNYGGSFYIDHYTLFPPNGASEDIILSKYRWVPPSSSSVTTSSTTITSATQPRDDILQPPLVPLIDPSLIVVWNTMSALTLFRDAAAWQHSVDVHRKEQGLENSPIASSSFILNMLLNDGRHVQSEMEWSNSEPGIIRTSEDTLKFRMYQGWGPVLPNPTTIDKIMPTSPEKCPMQGAMCCLQST